MAILGGVAAAVTGLLEWLAIPGGTRAKRIGLLHGAGNAVVMVVFLASLLVRWSDPAYLPDVLPAALSLLGFAISFGTAWLGGELVYRLRVGIDNGADLDAASSLSGPARSEP